MLIMLEQNKQHYSHVQQLGNLSSLALHVLTVVIKLSINHSTAFSYFLLVLQFWFQILYEEIFVQMELAVCVGY